MFKALEKSSKETEEKVENAIKKVASDGAYTTLYAYKELNLYIVKLITHYAIGFNDNEVVAVSIESNGAVAGNIIKCSPLDSIKFTIFGKLSLDNGNKKVKLVVPGTVPSIPGTEQLPVNQIKKLSSLMQFVKGLN